ncbi:MAG: hypothetical protein HY610_00580, partial [Elusimicrobia bacterium]|nr:hypothetical protein [Elusimicrobiota bacterium]
ADKIAESKRNPVASRSLEKQHTKRGVSSTAQKILDAIRNPDTAEISPSPNTPDIRVDLERLESLVPGRYDFSAEAPVVRDILLYGSRWGLRPLLVEELLAQRHMGPIPLQFQLKPESLRPGESFQNAYASELPAGRMPGTFLAGILSRPEDSEAFVREKLNEVSVTRLLQGLLLGNSLQSHGGKVALYDPENHLAESGFYSLENPAWDRGLEPLRSSFRNVFGRGHFSRPAETNQWVGWGASQITALALREMGLSGVGTTVSVQGFADKVRGKGTGYFSALSLQDMGFLVTAIELESGVLQKTDGFTKSELVYLGNNLARGQDIQEIRISGRVKGTNFKPGLTVLQFKSQVLVLADRQNALTKEDDFWMDDRGHKAKLPSTLLVEAFPEAVHYDHADLLPVPSIPWIVATVGSARDFLVLGKTEDQSWTIRSLAEMAQFLFRLEREREEHERKERQGKGSVLGKSKSFPMFRFLREVALGEAFTRLLLLRRDQEKDWIESLRNSLVKALRGGQKTHGFLLSNSGHLSAPASVPKDFTEFVEVLTRSQDSDSLSALKNILAIFKKDETTVAYKFVLSRILESLKSLEQSGNGEASLGNLELLISAHQKKYSDAEILIQELNALDDSARKVWEESVPVQAGSGSVPIEERHFNLLQNSIAFLGWFCALGFNSHVLSSIPLQGGAEILIWVFGIFSLVGTVVYGYRSLLGTAGLVYAHFLRALKVPLVENTALKNQVSHLLASSPPHTSSFPSLTPSFPSLTPSFPSLTSSSPPLTPSFPRKRESRKETDDPVSVDFKQTMGFTFASTRWNKEKSEFQVWFANWLFLDIDFAQAVGYRRAVLQFLQAVNLLLRCLLLPHALAQENLRLAGKGNLSIYLNPLLLLTPSIFPAIVYIMDVQFFHKSWNRIEKMSARFWETMIQLEEISAQNFESSATTNRFVGSLARILGEYRNLSDVLEKYRNDPGAVILLNSIDLSLGSGTLKQLAQG